jgi:hypothetical protein
MTDEAFKKVLAEIHEQHGCLVESRVEIRAIIEAAIKERDNEIAVMLFEISTMLNSRPGNDDIVSALDHLAGKLSGED